MKKSIFTFAVFSLVVLTSFTTVNITGDDSGDDNGDPTTTTQRSSDSGGQGNSQTVGGNKKHDDIVSPTPYTYQNQEITSRTKSDF